MAMRKLINKKGITFLELLIVIAVIGILVAIGLPQFSRIRENQVLKSAVNDVLSSLNKARSQTLASLNSSEYGVHFESDRVIIFTGTSYPGTGSNETIMITSPASITNVALDCDPSIPCDVYFNRLSGKPNVDGTLIISTTNYSRIITISATGVASSN